MYLWCLTNAAQAKDNARTYTDVPPLETHDILATYAIAHRRLICLDYDGTLSSYRPVHELSTPSVRVIAALAALASDPMNVIFIIRYAPLTHCPNAPFKSVQRAYTATAATLVWRSADWYSRRAWLHLPHAART